LVLQGAGASETLIGVNSCDWYYRAIKAKSDPSLVYSFTLRDVAVVGGYDGIHYEGDRLLLERCEFVNSSFGISVFGNTGHMIRDSYFHDHEADGLVGAFGIDGFDVIGCRFERVSYGISMQSVSNISIRNCVSSEAGIGVQFDGSSGTLADCQISGIPGSFYGAGVVVTGVSNVTMSHCTLDLEATQYYSTLTVINGSVLSGSGNVIRGGRETSVLVGGHGRLEQFHGNEIWKSDHYSVIATYTNHDMSAPLVVLDMSDNYWGTDIPDSIASWIDDAHDHPQDPQYWMEVIYHPYDEDPVTVEQKSLSEVKAMFR